MTYTWSLAKNRQNTTRHGIAFEDAARIFEGPTLERVDDRFDTMARSASTPLASLTASRSRSFMPMLLEMSAESFRHGRQSDMKEKRTGKSSVEPSTDWQRLGSLNDRQIRRSLERDTEARPTNAAFWKKARVVIPAAKQTVTIRLDADLLEWLRKEKGYQTRINAVLRTYMDANLSRTG